MLFAESVSPLDVLKDVSFMVGKGSASGWSVPTGPARPPFCASSRATNLFVKWLVEDRYQVDAFWS